MRSSLSAASLITIALGTISLASATPAVLFTPENPDPYSGLPLTSILTYSGNAAFRTFELLSTQRINPVRNEDTYELSYVKGKQINCVRYNDNKYSCSMRLDKNGKAFTNGWYDAYRADLGNLDVFFGRKGATDEQRAGSAIASKIQKNGISIYITGAAAELLVKEIPVTTRGAKANVLCQMGTKKRGGPTCSFLVTPQGIIKQAR